MVATGHFSKEALGNVWPGRVIKVPSSSANSLVQAGLAKFMEAPVAANPMASVLSKNTRRPRGKNNGATDKQ